MAKVLRTSDFVDGKKSLPFEGFFVDTNVIIAYSDPFSITLVDYYLRKDNINVTEFLNRPDSGSLKGYSTYFSLMEYYNYLQRHFYKTSTGKDDYTPKNFKEKRNTDFIFKNMWELQINKLKKLFSKTFPLYREFQFSDSILMTYDYSICEIGDHLLYTVVMNSPGNMKYIYTLDHDYYSFPDELTILTSNKNIIEQAEKDGKLIT